MAADGSAPDVLLTTVVRHARVRASTISLKRLSKRELERGRLEYPESATTALIERPKTRGDCLHGAHAQRPCIFAGCKHHLYLDVSEETGSIKVNFPDLDIDEIPETCALDVADRGGITLEDAGRAMNITRERCRQLESRGIARLASLAAMASLSDYLDEDPGT